MDFKGKTVVITGGANGIGKCLTEEFRKAGAKTAVIDISDKLVECDLFYKGDIADEDTLKNFSSRVIETFGKVDVLINNACISKGGIRNCDYKDFLYIQQIGVVAPYMLTKLFLPHFGENASVINIASTRAFQSQPNTESYTAAKGGIVALTHGLAVSLSGKVRVNCISPGWIDTTDQTFSGPDNTQHPAGRVGKPIDIAKTAMFLAGNGAAFITGENIIVDGGISKLMIYHDDNNWRYEND